MTPLIKALVAAQEVGFDAPECGVCGGSKTRRALEECYDNEYWAEVDTGEPCRPCYGTGLDASDPERLIGRAMGWLKNRMVQISIATYRGGDLGDLHSVAVAFRESTKPMMQEEHEDTLADFATAILRLVARAGGAT